MICLSGKLEKRELKDLFIGPMANAPDEEARVYLYGSKVKPLFRRSPSGVYLP